MWRCRPIWHAATLEPSPAVLPTRPLPLLADLRALTPGRALQDGVAGTEQVQLYRVVKWIACTFAIKLVARQLLARRKVIEKSDEVIVMS